MKKFFFVVGGIVILALAWWLVSPLWRNVALQEDLPRASGAPSDSGVSVVRDATSSIPAMDAATKADFEKQMMEMKDKTLQKNDTMPENQPTIVSRTRMIAGAHDVSGEALIVKSGAEHFLRFENLKTINGPDLHIYLSSVLNANDAVDLGSIRATEGNVNYAIPAGTDLTKYKNALIWCRPFSVLFSYAQF